MTTRVYDTERMYLYQTGLLAISGGDSRAAPSIAVAWETKDAVRGHTEDGGVHQRQDPRGIDPCTNCTGVWIWIRSSVSWGSGSSPQLESEQEPIAIDGNADIGGTFLMDADLEAARNSQAGPEDCITSAALLNRPGLVKTRHSHNLARSAAHMLRDNGEIKDVRAGRGFRLRQLSSRSHPGVCCDWTHTRPGTL